MMEVYGLEKCLTVVFLFVGKEHWAVASFTPYWHSEAEVDRYLASRVGPRFFKSMLGHDSSPGQGGLVVLSL